MKQQLNFVNHSIKKQTGGIEFFLKKYKKTILSTTTFLSLFFINPALGNESAQNIDLPLEKSVLFQQDVKSILLQSEEYSIAFQNDIHEFLLQELFFLRSRNISGFPAISFYSLMVEMPKDDKTPITIGQNIVVEADETIVFGSHSEADEIGAVAIGFETKALGKGSIAQGYHAIAWGMDSIAIGEKAQSLAEGGISFGTSAITKKKSSISIGHGAQSNEEYAVAIGSKAIANGNVSVAIGADSVADNGFTVSLGFKSKSLMHGATALGANSQAESMFTTAIGHAAIATGNSSMALGNAAKSLGDHSIAIGNDSIAGKKNEVSFGNADLKRKLVNVEKGSMLKDSTDAINGGQLFEVDQRVEKNSRNITENRQKIMLNQDNIRNMVSILGGENRYDENGRLESVLYTFEQGSHKTVGSALYDLDGRLSTNTKTINQLGGDVILLNNRTSENVDNIQKIKMTTQKSLKGVAEAFGGNASFTAEGELQNVLYDSAFHVKDQNLTSVYKGFEYVGIQLIDHDQRITNNYDAILNIKKGTAGIVKLDSASNSIVIDNELAGDADRFNIAGVNEQSRILTGVANGIKSHDAVNIAQLAPMATALGGGATIDKDGYFVAPRYEFLHTTFMNVGDALTNLDQRTDKNSTAVESINEEIIKIDGRVTTNSNTIMNIQNHNAKSLEGIAKAFGGTAHFDEKGQLQEVNFQEALNIKDHEISSVYKGFEYVGTQLSDHDQRITNNYDAIFNIKKGTAGIVKLDSESNSIVIDNELAGDADRFNIAGLNEQSRILTGVANGIKLNDAVNVAQLAPMATALGGGAKLDDDGNFLLPKFTFGHKTFFTVGDALYDLDNRVNIHSNEINNINSELATIAKHDNGLLTIVEDELVIDRDRADHIENFNIATSAQTRKLTGVRAGEISQKSTDAINGSQYFATNSSIAKAFGGNAYFDEKGILIAPSYIIGGEIRGGLQESFDFLFREIKDVKDNLAQAPEGEGNGGNGNNGENGGNGGGSSGNGSHTAGGLFVVDGHQIIIDKDHEAAQKADTVNLAVLNKDGTIEASRKLTGVANGDIKEGSLDAVNGGQLWTVTQNLQDDIKANQREIININNTLNHYGNRLNHIEKTVHQNRKVASAGISGAIAMSSIPYSDSAKHSFGMGIGTYDGESAISMGLILKINADTRFKVQGAYDTQKKLGLGAGISIDF